MNLDDMARFVCGKVNQSEDEDILACKGFIRQRHTLLWTEALWKDALTEYRLTVSPDDYLPTSNWLPTKGVLLVPPAIDKVIAVRTDSRALNVQRQEFYYRIDFDAFAKTGCPADFVLLPACVWETDSAAEWYAKRNDAGDVALTVKADVLDTDGAGSSRVSVTMDEETRSLGSSERIDALLKRASTGTISLQASLGEPLIAEGETYSGLVAGLGGSSWTKEITGFVIGATYAFTLGNAVSLTAGTFGGPAENYTESTTFVAGFETYTLTGPEYNGPLPVPLEVITARIRQPLYDVVTFAAAATAAAKRQRVRLIEIPSVELTLRVLGKLAAPAFLDDLDTPGISGSENYLLAFAQADMLERERQYGKADGKMKEAAVLLEQLKRVEVAQQSHNQRIIPQGGYGDDEWNQGRGRGFSF
jgi:hypothetical protein